MKPIEIIVALAVVAGLIYRGNRDRIESVISPQQVSSEFSAPTGSLASQVRPITDRLRGNADADRIAYLFLHSQTLADNARSHQDLQKSNQKIADGLERVGGTNAPAIRTDVDRVFREYVGTTGALDEAARSRWREACRAIAWAAHQAADGGFFEAPSFRMPRVHFSDASRPAGSMVLAGSPQQSSHDDYDWRKFAGNGLRPTTPEATAEIPRFSEIGVERRLGAAVVGGEKKNDLPRWLTHSLRIDPAETAKLQKLKRFGTVFSGDVHGDSAGKTRLNYRAARHFDATLFSDERQVVGDCVSHATRNASDIARAIEILVGGEPESWVNRGATELIYGLRRHKGEGMVVTNIPDILTSRGGILARAKYGHVDLSRYDGHLGQRWGDRRGPPRELISEAQRYQIRDAALVTSTAEARDALWAGYAIVTGAQASFSEHRDSHGFGKRTGRAWAHSQCIAAVSTAYTLAGSDWRNYGRSKKSPCFLMLNSWGAWNDGPKGKFQDIPDGSYWITETEMKFLLSQDQVLAVGNFDGFPRPPIETFGFDYLNNPTPLQIKIDDKYFGLVEVASASMSESASDITLPDGVEPEVPDDRDPFRPRPPPEPEIDTRWMPPREAIALAHESSNHGPVVFLIGSSRCHWCDKQRAEIDKLHELHDLISTYMPVDQARKYFKTSFDSVPQMRGYSAEDNKRILNHVGFTKAEDLEKLIWK